MQAFPRTRSSVYQSFPNLADVNGGGTTRRASVVPHLHAQRWSTPEGIVHARTTHHVRGAHAWARGHARWGSSRGHARWGPSRGHAVLVWPRQHTSPAIQRDKSVLLRKALRASIESLPETGLCMLVLPAILQQLCTAVRIEARYERAV